MMQTSDMPTRISAEQHGRANQKINNGTIHHQQRTSSSGRQEKDLDERFSAIAAKMYAEGLPAALVKTFRRYYAQLLAGETGTIPSEQALAVCALPKAESLRKYHQAGMAALSQTVMIKLNGGLGTTMGLAGPKSLIPIKEGHSFLDIIVQQVLHMRQQHDVELPLLFMNSFNTEAATAAALAAYPELTQPIPLSFRQHKVPKLRQEDFTAIDWPDDTEKEWCPPGHGNLYLALYTSGLLKELLEQGYEYAFISNVDNLGATLDLDLLGYIAENAIPFLMEVAARTVADRKGGHLAQDANQRLILREIAQCPPEEIELFQDTKRYSYFNTNNIWLNLQALDKLLQQREGILDLPLIRNAKTVDATDENSPAVYQLETAMGQAISLFSEAHAVEVPRTRFLPVKDTGDLLALRSDLYLLDESYRIQPNPARQIDDTIVIELDPAYYRTLAQFEEHFPDGVPSLVNCRRLSIEGEIYFLLSK
ncbi:MAG TPA: UTP--glucose-1-phosphate uridylyltransferase [Caldilineaceae bacterium]|nr:UTP--glucose-1-phosphate uridylyltransferase [Caldilineaceae bacterium]